MKYEDLMRFCAVHDGPRLDLREPFVRDNAMCGTDGRALVRVPSDEPDSLRERLPKKLPDFPVLDPSLLQPWPAADLSLRTVEHCKSCGDGRWYFDNDNPDSNFSSSDKGQGSMECEECDGTAKYVHWKQMELSGHLYNSGYIWLIGTLPNVRYMPASSDQAPMYFEFDGGDGLLMPMGEPCDECWCSAKGAQP